MRGDNITVYVVCRMLNRGKFLDFFAHRKYDDTSRMLPCCTPDSSASLYNSINLAVTFMHAALFKIVLHITECSLLRKGTDGSCFEGLAFAKDNLCVSVGICLVFTGEVKVNIRLFISLESKKSFERDIKSFFLHLCSALRANLVRHIASCHTCIFLYFRRIKITVFAVRIRAEIMRWQRIYLCDTGHGRCQRRSYRSSGTYQISVLIGLPYQLLGNDIHYGISVGND